MKSKNKVHMTATELKMQLAMWGWTTKEAAARTGKKQTTVTRYTNEGKGYEDGVPQKFIAALYQARADQFK